MGSFRFDRVAVGLGCAVSTLFAAQAALAGPYDAWQFVTPITVTSTDAAVLSDYQVALEVDTATLITNGDLAVDGSDMRFATSDGNTALPYYIAGGLNTAQTEIWVRVPTLAAMGATTINMYTGNVAALDESDGIATFDLYEDFEDATTFFASQCGNDALAVANGEGTLSWSSNGVMLANAGGPNNDGLFPIANQYRVEADITSIAGTWPALYWYDSVTAKSYSLMRNTSQFRISLTGSGTTHCSGHNWASSLITEAAPGLWSFAWTATGEQYGVMPSGTPITSTSTLYPRANPLQLGIGGISSGTGNMVMKWVRVRKWAAVDPTSVVGVATSQLPGAPTITMASATGLGEVTIAFDPPLDTGATPITSYTATCGANTAMGAMSPLIVTGLTPGVEVACTVYATNAAGDGPESAPVNVTPGDVPDPPTIGAATPGDGNASIAFTPPTYEGTSPITQYTATCDQGATPVSGAGSPIVVTGLTNDQTYSCSVTATNAIGESAPSDAVMVTPTAGMSGVGGGAGVGGGGATVGSGGGATVGAGGSGATSGSGGSSNDDDPDADSGCSCKVAGAGTDRSSLLGLTLFLAAAGMTSRRRRQRHR